MGKAETTGQTKAVTTEKIFGYDDYSHARSKDSVDPHEADVKPRAKGLHASVPWTQDIISGFQQKIEIYAKKQNIV